jgi:hypothetical protein
MNKQDNTEKTHKCNYGTCMEWLDTLEELYWHRKIHTVDLEMAILNKQWELTTKQLEFLEGKTHEQ